MRALWLQLASMLCLLAAGLVVVSSGLPDRRLAGHLNPPQANETPVAAEVGALAPPIEGVDMRTGAKVSLAARRGKPVIINFWASWCAPCRDEMPALQAVASRVQVIGVSYVDFPSKALEFAETYGITYPLLDDPGAKIAELYQLRGVPTSLFIDRQGIIQHIVLGPLTPEQIEQFSSD